MTRQHTALIGWIAACVLATAFCMLGVWQLQRMHAKQQTLVQAGQARMHRMALPAALAGEASPVWAEGRGELLPQRVLLDNQLRGGRAGVRVYQPFRPAGTQAVVLVDLGWLPLPGDRSLPPLTLDGGPATLRGLLVPAPSAGLALGAPMAATARPGIWLATRIDPQASAAALGLRDISSQVLRLDPALPVGFERDLKLLPNTLPPARHLGYAVQWFGLALTVLAVAAVLQWRARRRRRGR